jgi:hypothetical protein
MISIGSYGGFYIAKNKGWSFRICLGWIAVTFWSSDLDKALDTLYKENKKGKIARLALSLMADRNPSRNRVEGYLYSLSLWGLGDHTKPDLSEFNLELNEHGRIKSALDDINYN